MSESNAAPEAGACSTIDTAPKALADDRMDADLTNLIKFLQARQSHIHNNILLADGKAVALSTMAGALLAHLSAQIGWSKFMSVGSASVAESIGVISAALGAVCLLVSAGYFVIGVLKPRYMIGIRKVPPRSPGDAVESDPKKQKGFVFGKFVANWGSNEPFARAMEGVGQRQIAWEMSCAYFVDQVIAGEKYKSLSRGIRWFLWGALAALVATVLRG